MSQSQILAALADLADAECEALLYDWAGLWARENQLPPAGSWFAWLLLAGRGFGKSRTGAEYIRDRVEHHGARRVALVGPTSADVRDVMVEGESGLLAVCPPWSRPVYEPSKRRLTWPNGAIATCYSADEPNRLRGPQHDAAWADELAAWRYADDAWDNLLLGLRLGNDPRVVVTTTPRPTKIIKGLMVDTGTVITRGSTYDNAANLAAPFLDKVRKKFEGTRLGRQELHAEILDDNPNALWQRAVIDTLRVLQHPDLERVVVAVDPAITANEDSDETGIVVEGRGVDGGGYVLEDASMKGSPDAWGRAAVTAYHKHKADLIVAEANQGGDMVRHVIATVDPKVKVKLVHASRGKVIRAEPVAALYEQGRYHHVGTFAQLEDQMCEWQPGAPSPDRMDAHVWGATELFLEEVAAVPRVRAL